MTTIDPYAPSSLGITRAGDRVHRLGDEPPYARCGEYLRRTFRKAPIEVAAPLCGKCFTAEERHALVLEEMARS